MADGVEPRGRIGMSEENTVLTIFIVAAVVMTVVAGLFFVRFRQHRRANRRALRLIAGNLVILLLLGSFAVLGGEIYYRFLYDTTDSFGLTKTTQRWFGRHFHFNESGFRDSLTGYSAALVPGRRRVTFIGDSFTAGHGIRDVEERFANLFRAMRPDLDVHVFAHCGWETGQELEAIETAGRRGYEMDLVVLVYCLNDVTDISPGWREAAGRIFDSAPPGYLFEHSYLFNTIYHRWQKAHVPEVARYFEFVRRDYEGPVWERQKHRLESLRGMVRARGGKLLVVTFPFLHALGTDYQFIETHERIDRFWRELNVPYLDLLDTYRGGSPDELTVNPFDAHPNERAHRMAAEAISAFLDEYLRE